MDPVVRAMAIYVGLMIILRLFGKRSMAQVTVFDFVLLLIIAESTQQALLGNDFSITNGLLVIITLITVDRLLDALQDRSSGFARLTQGVPVVVVHDGKPLEDRMAKESVSVDDVMEQARTQRGLESLDDVKFAVSNAPARSRSSNPAPEPRGSRGRPSSGRRARRGGGCGATTLRSLGAPRSSGDG